uniref:Sugar phosphate transporter domain-containing protein n=1 Tax=Oryza punctata TaxID=4537 RepID=A0A0E0MC86_ORYPU
MTIEKCTSPEQPPTLRPTNCSAHLLYARAPTTAGVTPEKPHLSFLSYLAQMGGAGDDGAKLPAPAAAMEVVSSSSSSPAPAPSVLRSVLLSYAYVSVWITLSFSVIVYNKYILDPKMYNWPFPISLTMIHMAFCASLAVVLVRVLRVVAVPTSPPMTPGLYAASVVPIGALYALSLWFSNSAYIYLSVSFIQMLKALMPVAFRTDSFRRASMLNMLGISAGVAVAAYGEARFDAFGVVLQLAAVAAEATRLVLIQILLTSKGMSLNPITSLYYIAPCCLVFLTLPWYFVELPRLRTAAAVMVRPDVFVFGTNSLCAFALNLAVFLLVGKTSALTMNVAGVVKDWLLIAFSWTVIKDTVTPVNLVGYGIAFLGVAYYNHAKLQGLKAREAERRAASMAIAKDGDAEAGARLLPEKDGGEQKN